MKLEFIGFCKKHEHTKFYRIYGERTWRGRGGPIVTKWTTYRCLECRKEKLKRYYELK